MKGQGKTGQGRTVQDKARQDRAGQGNKLKNNIDIHNRE